jgi:hypothetical protein
MTDEELHKTMDHMEKVFDEVPNPIHEPTRFAFYVKLYRYYYDPQRSNQSASGSF